jgi:type II secretory pathway pseudopilin PulG
LGVTLLETVLVFAIAAALVVMGLRQYQIYKRDADMQQMQASVDQLFQAAAKYYYANCKGGSLDPNINSFQNGTVFLNINNDLIGNHYLSSAPITNEIALMYMVQFNSNPTPRMLCISNTSGPCTNVQYGINYNWTIEVSVFTADSSTASTYLSPAQATCVGGFYFFLGATPCSLAANFASNCTALTTPTGNPVLDLANIEQAFSNGCPVNNPGLYNNILAWERLPSMASPNAQSDMWGTMPAIKQFKRSYEINPTSGITTNEYFLCGS